MEQTTLVPIRPYITWGTNSTRKKKKRGPVAKGEAQTQEKKKLKRARAQGGETDPSGEQILGKTFL